MKKGFGLGALLLVLLLVIAFLPAIRRTFMGMFPEGFQSYRCDRGIICKEGEFCQENVCRPVAAPMTNDYFPRTVA
jgi:hypothetical protein